MSEKETLKLVPFLVKLPPILTDSSRLEEICKLVISFILNLIPNPNAIDLTKFVDTIALNYLPTQRLYLRFQIPEGFFHLVKPIIEKAIPEAEKVFVDEKIFLEKPTDDIRTIPVHTRKVRINPKAQPQILDTRTYLEINKLWEHPKYQSMGTGLVVVCDSGISQPNGDPWVFFEDRLIAKRDFTQEQNNKDGVQHGSGCSNIIGGGLWPDHEDLRGGFPRALFAAAKIFTAEGYTYQTWIMQALDWVAELWKNPPEYQGKTYKPLVMNNSWGSNANNDGTDEMSVACDELWKLGVYVEFSMGNNGGTTKACDNTIGLPATAKLTAKTGATSGAHRNEGETQSLVASFTSRPKTGDGRSYPALRFCMAPGVSIHMYVPKMDYKSGTSFSGPWHSFVALILRVAVPSLTPDETWEIIRSTCWPMGYHKAAEWTQEEADCLEGPGELRPYDAFLKAVGQGNGNGNGEGFKGEIALHIDNKEIDRIPVDGDGEYKRSGIAANVGPHIYQGLLYDSVGTRVDSTKEVNFTVKEKEKPRPETEVEATNPKEGDIITQGTSIPFTFQVRTKT